MDRHLRRVSPHVVRRQAIRRKTRVCHPHFYARCSHWSFRTDVSGAAFRWARERWVLAGGGLLLVLLTLLGIPAWARLIHHDVKKAAPSETVALKLPPPPKEAPSAPVQIWQTVEVQPGDTLSSIFQARKFDLGTLAAIMDQGKDSGALKALRPGDELDIATNADGQLVGFRYTPDAGTQVTLTWKPDGDMQQHVLTFPIERHIKFAHGMVETSLAAAGTGAGLSRSLVMKLADIFRHDAAFQHGLKRGTHFTIVYDQIYRGGKAVGDGNILAAQFTQGPKHYTAYRFKEPDGSVAYYSESGASLQDTSLLRTPVRYKYISSTFGMRTDPIIHKWRLHAGVDYAAPAGTPIHAAGGGVITTRGWVRGFGNVVAIRNTRTYTTEYGHMSRFASGLRVGSRVKQGEVIGYVGATGWATGPHLHFEVLVNGRPENPLTVTMPKPQPLSGRTLVAFREQTAPLVAQIQLISNATQRLAQVDNGRVRTAATN